MAPATETTSNSTDRTMHEHEEMAGNGPLNSPLEDGQMSIIEIGAVVETSEQPSEGRTARSEEQPVAPYSAFKRWQIWVTVYLAAVAALFSPLSSNTYLPAIPVIAVAFNESIEAINVTVTVYMILQGISPMVWGSMADWNKCGRRPIYLSCLTLLCLSCVGLALTPTSDYWLLVLLRCVQAAGSASSATITTGTIMDVAAPAERGTMLAMVSLGALIAPCIGPVIGGLLAGNLGWRSIFWFLCIASGVVALVEAIFFPETLRSIVGDGSVPPQRWNRPLIPVLLSNVKDEGKSPEPVMADSNPIEVLKLFRNIDLCLILWTNSVPYSVVYCLLTTMSPTFLAVDPSLTEIDLGLMFLSTGGGAIAGTLSAGKLIDWDFRNAKKRALLKKGLRSEDAAEKARNTRGADRYEGIDSIERTRLRLSPIYWGIFVVIVIGYGWAANQKVNIACMLVLQFIAMAQVTAIFTSNQTLLMDLFPGRGASISASNNVARCLIAAVMVSIVDYIINGVGIGWTFTILGGWCVITYPLVMLEMAWGKTWRERRRERERVEQEKRAQRAR
ncbi:MFS general substrate transporter [Calocera viscosa TUFC12733]|uniref:MFS general substrate transporter n=1 Tax=Calocera viscosa (strain TUFC12733) TaxID=1330018 RepID=A0A167KEF8_CALVF|nr:MFS general substrate transporter [Calocera viscosa TUFC12733]